MNHVFENGRVFLIGGPGGVGKTTLSAALAAAFAEKGYNTACLTVDPARRLAQALGRESSGNDSFALGEHLMVSQLASDRFMDQLITRIAKDPNQRDRILRNPIYSVMASHLSGTQEYAAMERILEFAQNPEYQKIVVDTPPTQNAVDLLTAPKRLFDFMDGSVLKWFTGPGFFAGIVNRGTALALKALRVVLGSEFLELFAVFLKDIEGLQAGFQNRHAQLNALLRSETTAFVLATVATQERLLEVLRVEAFLRTEQIPLRAICVNQLQSSPPAIFNPPLGVAEWLNFTGAIYQSEQQVLRSFLALEYPVFSMERLDCPPESLSDLSRFGLKLVES